jgi:hypothetical protein
MESAGNTFRKGLELPRAFRVGENKHCLEKSFSAPTRIKKCKSTCKVQLYNYLVLGESAYHRRKF